MFCTNCGKKIADDSVFCEFCGAKIDLDTKSESSTQKEVTKEVVADKPKEATVQPAPTVNNANTTVNAVPKEPMSKKKKIGLFAGIGAAVVLLIVVVIFAVTPKTIKMDKFIVFESSGYDGYGNASAYIDWDAFAAQYGNKISFTNQAREQSFGLSNFVNPVDTLKSNVSLEQSSFNYLSNGDTVTVNVEVNPEALMYIKNKFSNLSITYSISGLGELTKIDLLSVLNDPYVKFSGPNGKTYATPNYKNGDESTYTDGDLTISVENNYNDKSIKIVKDNQLLSTLNYYIEEEGPFSNNDVVTLRLYGVEGLIENGYGPKEDDIKVTVSDRPEILADTSGVSEDTVRGFVSTYVYLKNISSGYEPYSSHCYKNEKSGCAFAMIAKPSTVTDSPASILIDYSYDYAYLGYKDKEYTSKNSGYMVLYNPYIDGNSLDCVNIDVTTYSDVWRFIDSHSSEYDFIQLY